MSNIFDNRNIEVYYYKTPKGRNAIKVYHINEIGTRLRCLYTGDENGKNTGKIFDDINNSSGRVRITGDNIPK